MSDLRVPQFGAILLRAAQLIGQQGQEAFDALEIDFDARKISIVLTIHKYGASTSSDIAGKTGLSRQLIESRLKALVKDGFLTVSEGTADARQRLYDFGGHTGPVVEEIVQAMKNFEDVYEELWKELGFNLEQHLLSFEQALAAKPLSERYQKSQ